jgi:hypothetical protein
MNWAVGIEGTPAEIEGQFNSFFHHGAIDETATLHHMSDSFAYIWTTEEKLQKYFTISSLHILLNKVTANVAEWTGKMRGVMPYAEKMGQERLQENERQARELEQRIRPPVEDWLRRTRNTVYLKQQMVVVYVEQY